MEIAARSAASVRWLETHWHGSPRCPICDHNTWTPGDRVAAVTRPCLVVTCGACGYALLFSAVGAGWLLTEKE